MSDCTAPKLAAEVAEREAKEAPVKAVLAREERGAAETEAAEAKAARVACVVPSLTGGSLAAAQHAVARAHCGLGKVKAPRREHGSLVVVGQSARHGSRLASGARVAVTLAAKRR